ncbi:hypothetical protein [Terriglobus aquaticus]|uniref:Sel1 repeat family protein n=1 Tax=Terriglobus aquaticus TaxID=940139 RepID=A0ABW9KG42_9BACT|nr:hypothetical protein [Terriglobus aquaticus]
MRFACPTLAALIAGPLMLAQTAPSFNVHQVFVQDDEDHPAINTPQAIAAFEQRHRDRSQQVRDLLAKGQITSADQLYDAAWVLQHGETADDYLLAHILAVDALAKGNTNAKWLTAATLDRYLQLARTRSCSERSTR